MENHGDTLDLQVDAKKFIKKRNWVLTSRERYGIIMVTNGMPREALASPNGFDKAAPHTKKDRLAVVEQRKTLKTKAAKMDKRSSPC